jgi:hypothetical protein
MIEKCMVWRKEDPKQDVMAAIREGAEYYKRKYGHAPNFVNVPNGRLTAEQIAFLSTRWTVATNAPAFFRNDIWLGVFTPTPTLPQIPAQSAGYLGEGE